MSNTQVRDGSDAGRLPGSEHASAEPSHIHIPRPSRAGQTTTAHRDEGDPVSVELALDDAA